jgi:quercetin dioxygenase-like cupin family protein
MAQNPTAEQSFVLVSVSEVKWEQLNPARGDQSPQAGTLWGDRKGTVPTGFLARFVDGFSSPPHIHNATYRAVVISGRIHNDDPDAADMWMPAGSFWTQPKGEVHITAAKGATNVALVEIDMGPYLVLSPEEAFDSGERPINVDASNIVWVDPPGKPASANGPKLAYLWGTLQDDQSNGTFVKLPAGFTGKVHSHGSTFRAVVIKGQLQYLGTNHKILKPGSYFSSKGESIHQISSKVGEASIIYVRTDGEYELTSSRE